jgi:hypothetical protein
MVAAELLNCFWKISDSPRVFCSKASYRRRGDVRGGARLPHARVARPRA